MDVIALALAIVTLVLAPAGRTSISMAFPDIPTCYVLVIGAIASIYLAKKHPTKLAKGALVVGVISLIFNSLSAGRFICMYILSKLI